MVETARIGVDDALQVDLDVNRRRGSRMASSVSPESRRYRGGPGRSGELAGSGLPYPNDHHGEDDRLTEMKSVPERGRIG